MLQKTLKNGHGFTIAFASFPNAFLFLDPTELTPPPIDGGDAIDVTTDSNTAWRTKAPRALKEMMEHSFTAAYDPEFYEDIAAAINVNNLITLTFPNGDSLAFYGYLKSFTPGNMTEGEMPTGEGSIVPTLQNEGAETAPVFTEYSG